jgi:mono/diheme cytochrome c family protein
MHYMGCGARTTDRRPRRLLVVLAQLALVAGLVVACTDAESPGLSSDQAKDAELVTGQQVYLDKCARCHGDAGGGGAGPKLADGRVVKDFPDPEAQAEVVRNGRGSMPAWEGKLTDAEIDAVVRYTREVL